MTWLGVVVGIGLWDIDLQIMIGDSINAMLILNDGLDWASVFVCTFRVAQTWGM